MKPTALLSDASIREAIRLIEDSRRGLAPVVDNAGRLVGTLTDGDIRRLILRGGGLESRVAEAMNRSPVTAPVTTPDHQLAALLRARNLEALPLLGADGQLAGIAHIRELVPEAREQGGAEGFVAAVVMAGGEGTRLRPITETIPKPLVEVGGMPLVERHVRHLARAGVRRIFLAVNYMADRIEAHFAKGGVPGLEIEFLREERKLGTAGALSLLPALEAGPLLVLNADVIHAADYANLLAYHVGHNATLTVAAVEHRVQIPYGVIRAEGGRVVDVEEKPSPRYLCNAGIYVLGPEARAWICPDKRADMTEIIRALAHGGASVCVFPMHEYWADIADVDDLARVRGEILKLGRLHDE